MISNSLRKGNALFRSLNDSIALGIESVQEFYRLVDPFFAVFLFLFMVLSCLLLVAEIPLFALKFKDYTWRNNSVKYIFLFGCAMCLCLGVSGIAAMIVWYVALSMATNGRPGR